MVKQDMTLAEALKRFRLSNRLSQMEFAKQVGLTQTRISLIERGLTPNDVEAEAISKAIEQAPEREEVA